MDPIRVVGVYPISYSGIMDIETRLSKIEGRLTRIEADIEALKSGSNPTPPYDTGFGGSGPDTGIDDRVSKLEDDHRNLSEVS